MSQEALGQLLEQLSANHMVSGSILASSWPLVDVSLDTEPPSNSALNVAAIHNSVTHGDQ